MADLGLPRSPWACYEAWQNNSDRWWQMSLRARLGVGAHANETNETLCVSFSSSKQRACMHTDVHMHKSIRKQKCTKTMKNIHRHDTCKSNREEILFFFKMFKSFSIFRGLWASFTHSPLFNTSNCLNFNFITSASFPLHTHQESKFHSW